MLNEFWRVFVEFSQKTNSFYGWYQNSDQPQPQAMGFLPLEKVVDGKFPMSGFTPYWILNEEKINDLKTQQLLNLYGDTEKHKNLLVCCHYLDDERGEALKKLLGPPDGESMQYILSSGRTVLSCLNSQVYGLKYCGMSVRKLEQKADRKMTPERVKSTTTVNGAIDSRSVFREDFGYTLNLEEYNVQNLNVIFRDYNDAYKKDRILVPAFTLYSRMSDSLKKIFFGDYQNNIELWLEKNIIPFYVKLIEESFFQHGYHYELHQQNLNFLIYNGHVEEVFYQDSCDVLEDTAYRHWVLDIPLQQAGLKRQAFFPSVGDFSRIKLKTFNSSISKWYRFHLDDFGLYQQSINVNLMKSKTLKYDFFKSLANALRKSFANHLSSRAWDQRAKLFLEYSVVFDSKSDLFKMLNAFRDLMLKCSVLDQGEVVPMSARQELCNRYGNMPNNEALTFFSYGIDYALMASFLLSEEWEVRKFTNSPDGEGLMLTQLNDKSNCHVVSRFELKDAVCF